MPLLSVIEPQGAFYAFVNIKGTGLTSEEFAVRLLQEQRVVTVPGSGFGSAGEGYIRLSYVATPEDTRKGLARIRKFVEDMVQA